MSSTSSSSRIRWSWRAASSSSSSSSSSFFLCSSCSFPCLPASIPSPSSSSVTPTLPACSSLGCEAKTPLASSISSRIWFPSSFSIFHCSSGPRSASNSSTVGEGGASSLSAVSVAIDAMSASGLFFFLLSLLRDLKRVVMSVASWGLRAGKG